MCYYVLLEISQINQTINLIRRNTLLQIWLNIVYQIVKPLTTRILPENTHT